MQYHKNLFRNLFKSRYIYLDSLKNIHHNIQNTRVQKNSQNSSDSQDVQKELKYMIQQMPHILTEYSKGNIEQNKHSQKITSFLQNHYSTLSEESKKFLIYEMNLTLSYYTKDIITSIQNTSVDQGILKQNLQKVGYILSIENDDNIFLYFDPRMMYGNNEEKQSFDADTLYYQTHKTTQDIISKIEEGYKKEIFSLEQIKVFEEKLAQSPEESSQEILLEIEQSIQIHNLETGDITDKKSFESHMQKYCKENDVQFNFEPNPARLFVTDNFPHTIESYTDEGIQFSTYHSKDSKKQTQLPRIPLDIFYDMLTHENTMEIKQVDIQTYKKEEHEKKVLLEQDKILFEADIPKRQTKNRFANLGSVIVYGKSIFERFNTYRKDRNELIAARTINDIFGENQTFPALASLAQERYHSLLSKRVEYLKTEVFKNFAGGDIIKKYENFMQKNSGSIHTNVMVLAEWLAYLEQMGDMGKMSEDKFINDIKQYNVGNNLSAGLSKGPNAIRSILLLTGATKKFANSMGGKFSVGYKNKIDDEKKNNYDNKNYIQERIYGGRIAIADNSAEYLGSIESSMDTDPGTYPGMLMLWGIIALNNVDKKGGIKKEHMYLYQQQFENQVQNLADSKQFPLAIMLKNSDSRKLCYNHLKSIASSFDISEDMLLKSNSSGGMMQGNVNMLSKMKDITTVFGGGVVNGISLWDDQYKNMRAIFGEQGGGQSSNITEWHLQSPSGLVMSSLNNYRFIFKGTQGGWVNANFVSAFFKFANSTYQQLPVGNKNGAQMNMRNEILEKLKIIYTESTELAQGQFVEGIIQETQSTFQFNWKDFDPSKKNIT
jgi:hypothetical protein